MMDAVAVNENPSTITENQSVILPATKSSINAKIKRIGRSDSQVALS